MTDFLIGLASGFAAGVYIGKNFFYRVYLVYPIKKTRVEDLYPKKPDDLS